MSSLERLKTKIENANAVGIANLNEKGVELSQDAATYEIMKKIADVKQGTTLLDNTVVFNIEEEPYQIMSVKTGNKITEPIAPEKNGEHFNSWLTSEEKIVQFPYAPTADTEFDARFTELEYIESTGSQWIDTGIVPVNHRVIAKMQLVKVPSELNAYGLFIAHSSDYSKIYGLCYYNNTWYYYAGSRHTNSIIPALEMLEIDFNNDNNEFVLNGEVIGTMNGACNTSYRLPIFARTKENSSQIDTSTCSYARLYYFQIYDKTSGDCVRDFIPAVDSSGVVCLYDKVTKAYFYNQGAGSFTTN